MLRHRHHFLCGVSTHNYKTRVTAGTLKAIAGLDAEVFGFSRAECCGPVPAKLPRSFAITDHVVLNTQLPPTEWAKRTQNVPFYTSLEKRLKETIPTASLLVCHTTEYPANTVLRFNLEANGKGRCQRYTVASELQELPWSASAPQALDCTGDYFIFICSHRTRDARCGYCGPVLVDILTQEMRRAFPDGRAVHVIPCSHFGGHVYAGNVLVYSRHGGVCFGCFTPSDVGPLTDFVRCDDGVVPDGLKCRVRGRMTAAAAAADAPTPQNA